MAKDLLSRADTGLPAKTLAEIGDGIALALDALGGRRIDRRNIEEACGHLRFAERRAARLSGEVLS